MRLIRLIALSAVLGLLAACVTEQVAQPLEASAAATDDGSYSAATLAPLGSFEWKIAPSYTRNALVRHNTAKALRKQEITLAVASNVLKATDRARTLLDNAIAADARKDVVSAENLAKAAADVIAQAEIILRGVQ